MPVNTDAFPQRTAQRVLKNRTSSICFSCVCNLCVSACLCACECMSGGSEGKHVCLYVCVPVCGNQGSTLDIASCFFAPFILWQDPLLSLRLISGLHRLVIIVLEILLSPDRITRTVPCLAFWGMIGIQIQVFMLDQQALYWQLSTQPYKFDFLILQWKVKRKTNIVLYMACVFNYTFAC